MTLYESYIFWVDIRPQITSLEKKIIDLNILEKDSFA